VNSFEPLETVLEPKSEKHFAPVGGRPTNGEWPYYNIAWPNEGLLFVVGWPGQWASAFIRDDKNGLQLRAGQEQTHFVLHAGEEVRTPLILLQFYKGDWLRAQNIWRRFMFAHVFPKPKEGALSPVLAACSGWQFPNLMCNQAGEIQFIDRYLDEGIHLNYWWMDAGWYPCDGVGWPKVGTWEVDPKRYPGGLRAVTDHAHSKGMKGLVWFEPERVHPGTWLAENHPDWVFGGKDGGLLNIGDPEVRQWLTEHVDKLITEQGIDLYRQDFNIDPLEFWHKNDAKEDPSGNRQGITENRHVEGYLAYWDELRGRHPGMLIDSCASGGRRDDLETMRRAVPLLRTDFEFNPTGNQCCTYGFDMWLPYHECGNREITTYDFRSNMAVWMGFCWDVRRTDLNYTLGRKLVSQWKQVANYYLGDFFPLTAYSTSDDVWMAWQFDRPDLGEGMVQAFRRPQCIYEVARIPLQSLDNTATYSLRSLDTSVLPPDMTGRDLMQEGLRIEAFEKPGAAIFTYKKKS
jgi:alpha-galactosidase